MKERSKSIVLKGKYCCVEKVKNKLHFHSQLLSLWLCFC